MAKSTVDLVRLLTGLNTSGADHPNMPHIIVWPDGSYIIRDGDGNDLLDSDKIDNSDMMRDVHGLVYESSETVLLFAKEQKE